MIKLEFHYLDYNSTTPLDDRLFEIIAFYLGDCFVNSSSSHTAGKHVSREIENARAQIAKFINSEASEIIFTSGATESINLVINGTFDSFISKKNHIVVAASEHKAVIDTCNYLRIKGLEVTYLPVSQNGFLEIEVLKESIREDTFLVSVMYVNNETGVIQPIKEIAAIAHEKGALFMTDATQAAGKIKIDVDDLDVDLLCFSGHKMYAPKGIGALYVRNRGRKVQLVPQIHGGGHEQGLRSGTLNVPGIMALAKACEIAEAEMEEDAKRIGALRDYLETELLKLPNTSVNGSREHRIFNTTNICFKGQDANVMIGRMKDVAVSNGSACSSAVMEPSHVLKAMGLSDEDAFASLRFSLGKYNTIEDINTVIQRIKEVTQT
jgi:cysteine desulfurase